MLKPRLIPMRQGLCVLLVAAFIFYGSSVSSQKSVQVGMGGALLGSGDFLTFTGQQAIQFRTDKVFTLLSSINTGLHSSYCRNDFLPDISFQTTFFHIDQLIGLNMGVNPYFYFSVFTGVSVEYVQEIVATQVVFENGVDRWDIIQESRVSMGVVAQPQLNFPLKENYRFFLNGSVHLYYNWDIASGLNAGISRTF